MKQNLGISTALILAIGLSACATHSQAPVGGSMHPLYGSTGPLKFDIIQEGDETSFLCLHYRGRATRQMWDKRVDNEFNHPVFLFYAYFTYGIRFEINVNPEFETVERATKEAFRYTRGLGQLPTMLRRGIDRFGIHDGDETASAGAGKIFVYRANAIDRQGYHHLEETLFHEAVHVSLDPHYMYDRDWRAAQEADPGFVTRYARDRYPREDMAESALLAYGILRYPGRIPAKEEARIRAINPNRIAFLATLLPVDAPIFEVPDGGQRSVEDGPPGCMTEAPA